MIKYLDAPGIFATLGNPNRGAKSMSSWTGERSTAGLQRPDLEKRVGELERLIAELRKVIQLTVGGVSIESPGMVKIRGASVTLEAFSSIDIKCAGTCNIKSSLLLLNGQQSGGPR